MLDPEKNILPDNVKHIYMMGICGTGMSALAGILKSQGFYVTGSDNNPYPPISDFLNSLNIPIFNGYSHLNLRDRPDLVIIGNVIKKNNPEVLELLKQDIPYLSFPQAIEKLLLAKRKSIVIAGTHGKTTTTCLIAWILEKAGLKPGFIAGGISNNFKANFAIPAGLYFVIEGDEYDTAFFDKRPKFLHYDPFITIITTIEFDHADIYRDIGEIIVSFRGLIRLIPEEGLLVYNRENSILCAESTKSKARCISYGLSINSFFSVTDIWFHKDRTYFEIYKEGKPYAVFNTLLYGNHNISNMLAAVSVADSIGINKDVIYEAIREFKGVKRRLDHIGERNGILIIDDFAHHPTAVRETIEAVKNKFPKRRLIAVFEPRSNSSRRNIFQKLYSLSFDRADIVMIPESQMMKYIPESERFSSFMLVEDLRLRGIDAYYFSNNNILLDTLIQCLRPGDVVLFMSSGSFDNLPYNLFNSL